MNSFFHFKQFTIQQAGCAMKVTEIACIQGAWTKIPVQAKKVLDLGCGTGLLALMLAQKNPELQIDALEIEKDCYLQAKENIGSSSFSGKINCIHSDIKDHSGEALYDFIISNPPFFENDLPSPSSKKNIAWHSHSLPLKDLATSICRLLKPDGNASILFPFARKKQLEEVFGNTGLFPREILTISHSYQHEIMYMVMVFSTYQTTLKEETLVIKNGQTYTPEFLMLMKEFYLNL